MRYSIRIALLALGTVLGYGFAFGSMHHHRYHRDAWERHVADVCVGAAKSGKGEKVKTDKAAPSTEATEP